MGPMGASGPRSRGRCSRAVRDATAAGPLIPNELLMVDANPSVRVGPIAAIVSPIQM